MEAALAMPDTESLYRALVTRDTRLDGTVFYGIASTGIYCRPVCPARTPKFQNCRFFTTAAAAQDAGFRPCLRCRPETAPRSAAWRGTSNTVARALQLIEEGALDGDGATVDALAGRVGVGERQLRRLFLQQLGVSPLAVAGTRRVLFAKQLLHDTCLPIAAVAEASGFGSERRFHEVFQDVFKRPPSAIRRAATTDVPRPGEDVSLRVRYRPPFYWDSMLTALQRRCTPGVDSVHDGKYERVFSNGKGSVQVSHDAKRSSLLVAVRSSALRELPMVLSSVRRLFDTDADILRIEADLSADAMLAPLIHKRRGIRVPGEWVAPACGTLLDEDVTLGPEALRAACFMDSTVNTLDALAQRAEAWRPWRAYAQQHLLLSNKETECRSNK